MFGLFDKADIRVAKKLEFKLISQEAAYERGDWPAFVYAGQQVPPLLGRLNIEFGWTEEQLNEFLVSRRYIKSLKIPGYRDQMIDAQRAAGALY